MVGDDDDDTAFCFNSIHHFAYAFIGHFHRFFRWLQHTGMAYHIRVSEVQNDRVMLIGLDLLHRCLSHFISAHLRLKVICRDLRRINEYPCLPRQLYVPSTAEEECNVRVFLCLGNSKLCLSMLHENLAKRVIQILWFVGYITFYRLCKQRQADEMQTLRELRPPVKALEIFIRKYVRQLNGPVRTEVQEHDRVTGLDESDRLIMSIHDNGRHDELVKYRLLVGFRHGCNRISIFRAFAVYHGAIRFLNAIPTLVAIHCIVAALHRGDLAYSDFLNLRDKTLDEAFSAVRSHVAAIQERMNIDLVHLFLLREIKHSEQMVNMAVDTAVGE
ncbi:hypothetical protein D3C77_355730 [compost metagenome]